MANVYTFTDMYVYNLQRIAWFTLPKLFGFRSWSVGIMVYGEIGDNNFSNAKAKAAYFMPISKGPLVNSLSDLCSSSIAKMQVHGFDHNIQRAYIWRSNARHVIAQITGSKYIVCAFYELPKSMTEKTVNLRQVNVGLSIAVSFQVKGQIIA